MNGDALLPASPANRPGRGSSVLAAVFGALLLAAGVIVALAVGESGYLALLLIPVALIFAGALVQPELGLLALIFITTTQLSNVAISVYHLPSLAQPLAGMLMLVILIRFTLYGERPVGWARVAIILGAFGILWLASLLHAADYDAARTSFVGFIKDAIGGVIIIFLVQRPTSLRRAVWAFILAGLLMGTICVYQYVTGTFSNEYGGFGNIESQVSGEVSRNRMTGPYANPNAFAQVLTLIIPLALDRLWHERSVALKIVAGWTAAAGILTVFFTYSRGGLLAMLAAVAVLLLMRRPGIFPLVLTGALLVGLLNFLPASYTDRINTLLQLAPTQAEQISDPSFRGRLSENTAAMQMFWDNPLLGVGLGNFRVQYQDYSRQIGIDPRRDPRSPASLYLEMLSEQGLIGAGLFIGLIYLVLRGLFDAKRKFQEIGLRDTAYVTAGLIASLTGYMTAAIVKNSAYANVFWILIGVSLAAAQVARVSMEEVEETRASGITR